MLPEPRVIAIDDDPKHLKGLTQGLNQYGTVCLPVHYTGEKTPIPSCPHARIIFSDLHLVEGSPGNYSRDFSAIGGLLENMIKPSGPYLIILWTRYPEQADRLHDTLKEDFQDIAKPFAVQPLDKKDYLNPEGAVKSPEKLVEAIRQVVTEQPQVGALLNWEERVLEAAADTASSITRLAESATRGKDVETSEETGRLIANLAVASAGKEHVGRDRFRAVNESLLPILGDRIASMRSRKNDNELWKNALGEFAAGRELSQDEAAQLNCLLHIERPADGDGTERGAVIDLPDEFSGEMFKDTFDITSKEAAEKQFWSKDTQENADLQWVLVQTQAACDYAQTQPGPPPFHLGLCLPASEVKNKKKHKPPAALWDSPCFKHNDQPCFLHVNARFQVSLPSAKAKQASLLFRLREQLLNNLIYQIHGYGARPGIISLGG